MKVLSSSGRFAGKLIILLALLVVGVMAIAPMTPAGGQQGMWGGPQAAQDEGGVCQKVDVNVITLSIAALTTGISLDSIVNATTGIVLSPFVNGLCSFYSGLVSWVKGQDFVFSTGDLITYNQPTVDKMHDALLPVAGAILALLFAIAGHRIILGASPLRVLPRVTLAGVLVFASEPLLRYTIEINNGLCSLVLGAAVQNRPGENLASLFLMGTNPLNFSSINWIGGAIILFMGIAVSLQDLVRI